jgi:hypothetical protein
MKISGRTIELDSHDLDRAVTVYLLAQGIMIDGPRTVCLNQLEGALPLARDTSVSVHVDPTGQVLHGGQLVIDRASIPAQRSAGVPQGVSIPKQYRRLIVAIRSRVEAARWTDTHENREVFADWFEQHDAIFETRGPVVVLPEGHGQVQEGEWILFSDDDWLVLSATEFRGTCDEIPRDSPRGTALKNLEGT